MRDDVHPAVVQGFDKTLWVEYASDPTSSSGMIFNIWIGNSSPITGIHDVAVSSIRANSARWLNGGIGIGANVTASVGVTDYGDYSETTTLTIYYVKSSTQTILGSQGVTLAPGTTISLSFLMYTASTPLGNYTFMAMVTAVPGESVVNQGDNQLFDGKMKVTIPQDLTRDFDVDVDDLTLMQAHLFAANLAYDVNFDRKVDVADLISVWQHLYIPVTAMHDVGITAIKIPQYIYRGQTINVNVTVVNEGQFSENFNLMLFYNSTSKTIASVTLSSLAPNTMRTVSIPWNTTATPGVSTPTGGCFFSAYIPPLPLETHTSDNNFTAQYTLSNCVRKTGDVDAIPDGAVDITDVLAVFQHEFTTLAQYDVNGDGKVDVSDLIATFLHEFT